MPCIKALRTVITALVLIVLGTVIAHGQTETPGATDAEITFWRSVEGSADAAEFAAYLEAFPDGVFAALARIRIKQIEQSAQSGPRALGKRQDVAVQEPSPIIEGDIGYVGVEVGDVSPDQARAAGLGVPRGAHMITVLPGGPAERSGLRAGDIVLKLAGFPIADMVGFTEVAKTLVPGSPAKVELIRDGDRRTLELTAGAFIADNIAAADSGDSAAMLRLHILYVSDRLGAADPDKAMQYLRSAVEANNAAAIDRLARYHWLGDHVGQDFDRAVQLLQKSADMGHVGSLLALGHVYLHGKLENVAGPLEKDPAKALTYYRRAAEAGSPEAADQVGSMYDQGQGTAENNSEAVRWYQKAAQSNVASSILRLGMMYHNSEGVQPNTAEAARYYQRYIELRPQESWVVAFNYAILLASGDGVSKDERKAAEFLYAGLRGGDEHTRTQLLQNSGSWSEAVRRHLQALLKSGGFYDGGVDGAFGPKTDKAIELASQGTDGPGPDGAAPSERKSPAPANDLGLGVSEDFSALD